MHSPLRPPPPAAALASLQLEVCHSLSHDHLWWGPTPLHPAALYSHPAGGPARFWLRIWFWDNPYLLLEPQLGFSGPWGSALEPPLCSFTAWEEGYSTAVRGGAPVAEREAAQGPGVHRARSGWILLLRVARGGHSLAS